MNNLSYTISSNYFFHTNLSKEQRLSGMKWDKPDSRGRITSGILSAASSYSITEFIANKEFSVSYQSETAQGYLLIINQLCDAAWLQIKTQDRLETDYSPREIEMFVIPANKNLTINYAPQTFGRRLEIFIDASKTEELLSSDILQLLKNEDALYLSNRIPNNSYEQLAAMGHSFFKEAFAVADSVVANKIIDILEQFNKLVQ